MTTALETSRPMLSETELAAGFAAEKVFGTTINKALGRLFKTAEKTQTTLASTGEALGGRGLRIVDFNRQLQSGGLS